MRMDLERFFKKIFLKYNLTKLFFIFENLVLIPKLEYQPQFGCEKLSKRTYCKMWTKSYIKNNSDILLCKLYL